MSRFISQLLQAPEPSFSHRLKDWESISGYPVEDVRFTAELKAMVVNVVRELGLDVRDTTSRELYFALRTKALHDQRILEAHMSIQADDSPEVVVDKIINYIDKSSLVREAWVMKPSIAKSILKKNPPKKFMKQAGYRSVDSILKRKPTGMLLAYTTYVEKPAWLQKVRTSYKKLRPSDFAQQHIELHIAGAQEVEKLRSHGHLKHDLVLPSYELGLVVIVPATQRFEGDVLAFTTAILESIRSIRMHSTYYRALSLLPDFGKEFINILEQGLARASEAMLNTSWSHIHALHKRDAHHVTERFQPYLQQEDLHVQTAARTLSGWLPEFRFWQKFPYVYQLEGGPVVSSDLFDVAINLSNDLPFHQASSQFGRHNVSNELHARYYAHEPIASSHIKWYDGGIE